MTKSIRLILFILLVVGLSSQVLGAVDCDNSSLTCICSDWSYKKCYK